MGKCKALRIKLWWLGHSISKTEALVGCSRSAVVSTYQKWSKVGKARLIDACGEWRLAGGVRTNRQATVAQIDEKQRWFRNGLRNATMNFKYTLNIFFSFLYSGGRTMWEDTWTQTRRLQSCVNTWPRSLCSSPGEASAVCPSVYTLPKLMSWLAWHCFTRQTSWQKRLISEPVPVLFRCNEGSRFSLISNLSLKGPSGKALVQRFCRSNGQSTVDLQVCLFLLFSHKIASEVSLKSWRRNAVSTSLPMWVKRRRRRRRKKIKIIIIIIGSELQKLFFSIYDPSAFFSWRLHFIWPHFLIGGTIYLCISLVSF